MLKQLLHKLCLFFWLHYWKNTFFSPLWPCFKEPVWKSGLLICHLWSIHAFHACLPCSLFSTLSRERHCPRAGIVCFHVGRVERGTSSWSWNWEEIFMMLNEVFCSQFCLQLSLDVPSHSSEADPHFLAKPSKVSFLLKAFNNPFSY